MRKWRAILFVTALFVVLFAVFSVGVSAEIKNGMCGEQVMWSFDTESGVLTISGTGSMIDYEGEVVAPWEDYRDSITNVKIEDGVTNIGCAAFEFCSTLRDISIPSSVTRLGEWAFYGCTSLTEITIPNGVKIMEPEAFFNCTGLESITIPRSVTSIGSEAFKHCTSLKRVINHSDLNIVIGSGEHGGVASYAQEVIGHTYDRSEKLDELTHKRACECGAFVPAEHAWNQGVITQPATHTTEGIQTFSCACGETYTVPVAMLTDLHDWDEGKITIPATHMTDGVKTFCCIDPACDATKTEDIARLGVHEWDNGTVIVPATHTSEGQVHFMCICGETRDEAIDKLSDHEWGEGVVTIATTHFAEGEKTYTCACGATKIEKIDRTADHTWNEGRVVTEPTYDAEGEMMYTCAYCNKLEIRKIPKLSAPNDEAVSADSEEAVEQDHSDESDADDKTVSDGILILIPALFLVPLGLFVVLFVWKKKKVK